MLDLFAKSPSASVRPLQKFTYIVPPSLNDNNNEGLYVHGVLHLDLPKVARINQIIIELESEAILRFPGKPARKELLFREAADLAEAKDQLLCPGQHVYNFAVRIPPTAAPHERTIYGRIDQKLRATVYGDFKNGCIKSESDAFWLIYPVNRGEIMPELDFNKALFSEALGVYRMECASPLLTQAALFRTCFTLEGPPTDIHIRNVTATLIQSYTLQSTEDPLLRATPEPTKINLFSWSKAFTSPECIFDPPSFLTPGDSKSVAVVPAHSSFKLFFSGRMPIDRQVRPTTHELSITPITISHKMQFTVLYSSPSLKKGSAQQLVFSFPLSITSCCCHQQMLELPIYSPTDLQSEGLKAVDWLEDKESAALDCACVCDMDRDQLEKLSPRWLQFWKEKEQGCCPLPPTSSSPSPKPEH